MDSQMSGRYAAMMAPAVNRTWEALTLLSNTADETDPVVVSFPRPCLVAAVYPSIARASVGAGAGLLVPGLDDVLVELSLDEETRLTNRFDVVTQPSGVARVMVSLGAFRDTTGGARLFNLDLPNEKSEIVVRYRWKHPAIKGNFESVSCGMAFHALFKDAA